MANSTSSTIFSSLADMFTVKLGSDLFSHTSSLISGIAPFFSICFGIYVLLVITNGYGRGFDENILDFSKRMFGWLIVIACAFNAAQYAKLANIIYNMPEELCSLFNTSFGAGIFDSASAKLEELIDKLVLYDRGLNVFQVGSHLVMSLLVIFPVSICGYTVLGVSFAFYAVAKISLALVLAVGPLFLGAMLFPATRQYAMNWIGQCLNYIISILMLSIISSILIDFFNDKILSLGGGEFSSVAQAMLLPAPFLLMTLFFLIVIWNIPQITSALTGGASFGGFAMAARNISSAGGATSGLAGRGAKMAGRGTAATYRAINNLLKKGNSISTNS
ncbi:type IV secretion system protein [Neisseriaceae bacterium ESL0693]|nr:type IV secretion system protein [Neisseriaceae bacterium ESL0693]